MTFDKYAPQPMHIGGLTYTLNSRLNGGTASWGTNFGQWTGGYSGGVYSVGVKINF
jgi:hypothetical protein